MLLRERKQLKKEEEKVMAQKGDSSILHVECQGTETFDKAALFISVFS